MLTSQRANNSHWTLCSRWRPWKQNILYSESSRFPPLSPHRWNREKGWMANPFRGSSGFDPSLLKRSRSYSHVWALKVPLRLSDHQRFTTMHASLTESCVWAWSRRWYACERGRVGPLQDLLWYFNRRHLMSVSPDGPSITFPAPALGPAMAANGSH